MNKNLQVIALGVALLATGTAAASDKFERAELNTLNHEYKRYSPYTLTLPNSQNRTSIQTLDFHDQRTFSTDYDFDNNYFNNNVEVSFHRAFHTIPTIRIGTIGFGAALFDNSVATSEYVGVSGPVYVNYTSANGHALVLDYKFSEKYRLAFIGTNYEYLQAGKSLTQKSKLGFYFGVSF